MNAFNHPPLVYTGRRDLGPEHIKWILSTPRQKVEQAYAEHIRQAQQYRRQADRLLVQARTAGFVGHDGPWGGDPMRLRESADIAIHWAKQAIEDAKALRATRTTEGV